MRNPSWIVVFVGSLTLLSGCEPDPNPYPVVFELCSNTDGKCYSHARFRTFYRCQSHKRQTADDSIMEGRCTSSRY